MNRNEYRNIPSGKKTNFLNLIHRVFKRGFFWVRSGEDTHVRICRLRESFVIKKSFFSTLSFGVDILCRTDEMNTVG